MSKLYGITNIAVKTFDIFRDETEGLNEFLAEYNGNIIEIQTVAMFQGVTRYVVIYRFAEDHVENPESL